LSVIVRYFVPGIVIVCPEALWVTFPTKLTE